MQVASWENYGGKSEKIKQNDTDLLKNVWIVIIYKINSMCSRFHGSHKKRYGNLKSV